MSSGANQSKPRGFNLFTRIVFVHQAFTLALLGSGLSRGGGLPSLFTVIGLVIVVATAIAMFGLVKQKSRSALAWLRVLLWAAVARGLLSMLTPFGASDAAMAEHVRSVILQEAILLPVALYWSRAVHGRYLASLRAV